MSGEKNIPQHVAIIMDGNGRWAREHSLPRIAGHREGAKTAQEIVDAARSFGIKVLTLYTFSTENWKRPKKEVDALFKILEDYLDKENEKFNENNIRFSVIGRIEELPRSVREKLRKVMGSTMNNTGLVLNLALNYGGRPEIIDAVKKVSKDVKSGKLDADSIDENIFSGYLYTAGLPDPDLLIRTSGEFRLSNFLLWQVSYSEIYVAKKMWPDFKKEDFKKAIDEYRARDRRYGGGVC